MRTAVVLFCSAAVLAAVAAESQRIVGGSATTIDNYPSMVAMLYSSDLVTYSQKCGGAILTNRMILTAAYCTDGSTVLQWRGRVGSSYANSGGEVYQFSDYVNYPWYDERTRNNDIGIVRTFITIIYSSEVQRVGIASANYYLPDDSSVWATGWGITNPQDSSTSEVLNHVQVFIINQAECRSRYATIDTLITDNMLCSGVLDVGGRDQCEGDFGGPLYHNGVVVGVSSGGEECGLPFFPRVNTRVSVFASWISDLA